MRVSVWLALLAPACSRTAVPPIPEWRLSERPMLTIGADGRPEAEFHQVAGAVRLGSGEIAVANGGSHEIRYFGPDGRYLRTFGREGAGPGEFRSVGRLIRFGDTLAVHDVRTSRLTILLGATLLETRLVRASNATQRISIVERLPDGRWVGVTSISPRFAPQPYRDSIAVGILPAPGEGAVQWLGWFPGPRVASIEGKITGLAGFYTWVYAAVAGGRVVVLDGHQERIRRFSPDGAELPGGGIGIRGEPLTPRIVARAKQDELGPGADDAAARQWLEVKYAPEVVGDRLPAFRSLRADSHGLVWLESYRTDESRPGRYFVFSADAAPVATVAVPGSFRATEIGADCVLGVTTDADGVERVTMYRLVRS
ncbi:MAG TPA: hypothetical protein VFN96_03200 [Gemmatimonadales bacterium]|nr:hypothetical protein [Gemmatimonadales bacterium]